MGKFTIDGPEQTATYTEGTLNAAGSTAWQAFGGRFNVVVSGAFTGSARLDVSFDGGATAIPVTGGDGQVRTITGPERLVLDEAERGVLYRLVVTALSSGTVKWRFSR